MTITKSNKVARLGGAVALLGIALWDATLLLQIVAA